MSEIKKTFAIDLDLKQPLTNYEWRVVAGDTGNVLVVTLTDGGTPVDLTDARLIMLFSRGTSIAMQTNEADDGSISVSGANHNIITVDLRNGSFAPGLVESYLQIYSGYNPLTEKYESLVTTAKFNFRCDRELFGNEYVMSLDSYSILTSLISEVQAIIEGRIQADWSEDDVTSPQYIQNKPTSLAPTAHASTHATAGDDELTPADIGAMAADATPTPAAHVSTHEIGGTDALPAASTSTPGLVQLYDGVDSTSDTKAATANSAKVAYDYADDAYQLADDAIPKSQKGAASGVASLDSDTKVTAAQASAKSVEITSNTTLALTHAGRRIKVNSSSNLTITIPTNASVAFPLDTEIEFVRYGSGTVTFAGASGVTINSVASVKTIGDRYGCVCIAKMGTNEWLLAGDLG